VMKEITVHGVRVRYRWIDPSGKEIERCPLCGRELGEPDEFVIKHAIREEIWTRMKHLAKYVQARNRLFKDIKEKKITLSKLRDRYRYVSSLQRDLSFIVDAFGSFGARCEECGEPLFCDIHASVDVKPPVEIKWIDILELDEGDKSMKYFVKRQLGVFWPEIRRRVKEGDGQTFREAVAFLVRYQIYDALIGG